ncbi:MAG: thioredoxin family protein [Anaerolineae bacterium]|jgi:glutaredoxin-like protein|nr:thioredoxin family protein [Anaerolineae bacterium]MDX9833218.1 thioredoxin family protein [Anaerolineae bacterium]
MALISAKDAEHLRNEFETELVSPVKILMFTQSVECQFCGETRQIVEEVAELSDKITAEIYNFVSDKAVAELYGIDKIPAIAILRSEDETDKDYGIRFYGIPSGYEFTSIVEDIIDVSKGESGLQPKSKQAVAELTEPVHFQVFVTPTCPYCPQAVRLAHRFAMESDLIRADMIEAIEFPHLANKYSVYGVPRTVINENYHQEGAVPEPMMLAKLLEAVGKAPAVTEHDHEHEHGNGHVHTHDHVHTH